MSYRQVLITKPASIHFQNCQLVVECDGNQNQIPVEDIGIIMIESQQVQITSYCISELSKAGVVVHFCDASHIPIAMTIPQNKHYRPYEIFQWQQAQSDQLKAHITEQLLKAKIKNQYTVAMYCNVREESIQLLAEYEQALKGNDFENREGTAAKVFFNALYGKEFIRFNDDIVNSIQNYGYGVLRSAISQSLSAYGFTLFIGVNHKGKTNALNLVYDIIEPYRPIIDYYCYENLETFSATITPQIKKEIVYLLNSTVIVDNKQVTLQYSIDMLVRSYLRILEVGEVKLSLPTFPKIDFDKLYEPL